MDRFPKVNSEYHTVHIITIYAIAKSFDKFRRFIENNKAIDIY